MKMRSPRRVLRHLLNERRWRSERAQRGFSEADAWSLDHHLATVIAGGCRCLIDHMHGCPGELAPDGDVEAGCRAWAKILNEIAGGFEKYLKTREEFEPTPPEFNRSMMLLGKWWGHLWD